MESTKGQFQVISLIFVQNIEMRYFSLISERNLIIRKIYGGNEHCTVIINFTKRRGK